ncbi:MAG: hypothetical protein LBO72_00350, partial [Helicobacteraceae bacterium]|nr:hypothetical protein [Helicobacteraceae bacterium]
MSSTQKMIIAFAAILLAIMFFLLDDENEAIDPSKDPLQQTTDKLVEGTDEFYRWMIKGHNIIISKKPSVTAYVTR